MSVVVFFSDIKCESSFRNFGECLRTMPDYVHFDCLISLVSSTATITIALIRSSLRSCPSAPSWCHHHRHHNLRHLHHTRIHNAHHDHDDDHHRQRNQCDRHGHDDDGHSHHHQQNHHDEHGHDDDVSPHRCPNSSSWSSSSSVSSLRSCALTLGAAQGILGRRVERLVARTNRAGILCGGGSAIGVSIITCSTLFYYIYIIIFYLFLFFIFFFWGGGRP